MTGWAQVNGLRGNTSISDRLQHDLYYIYNWSFGLDIRIIARTISSLRHENGY
jgi:lipopolysaccharide/colanic/teichoic acid biosynthesis glycosyltransferase